MREPGCAVGGGPPARLRRCLRCRAAWCARGRRPAREPSALRAFGSARRLEARPGPAAAHGHRSQAPWTLRRHPHQWGLVAVNSPARPCRRPQVPQPGPLDPPVPSTPVTRGVLCVARRVGATQARPCRRPRAPPPCQRGYCGSSTFACNSPVTISEFELASLELQRFWALLKVHAIELHAEFLASVSVVTREVAQPRATASSHAVHADRLLLSG